MIGLISHTSLVGHRVAPLLLAALLPMALFEAHAAESGTSSRGLCPDVTGTYRVAGFNTAMTDALEVLGADSVRSFGRSGEVHFAGFASTGIEVRVANKGAVNASSRLVATFVPGKDFECRDGWIIFANKANETSRKSDDQWYYDSSTLRIQAGVQSGLAIAVHFAGSQRYQPILGTYGGNGLPRPFTSITLKDSIR